MTQATRSTASPPDVAVIIPHYDDLDRLRRCLEALAPQDRTGVEVVVADNASPAGLGDVPDRFGFARVVIQPEKGAAAARNKGVAETTAPALAFLDADCVPAPDWLDQVRRIAAGPGQVTGGRIDVFDETPPPQSGAEAFETIFAFDQAGYIAKKGFSVTANLVTTRAIFATVGPFVVGVSEDLDWCQRATAAGFALSYDPDLAVRHPTRSDWPALERKWRRLTEEAFGLSANPDGSHGARARVVWAMRGLAMGPSVLWHMPRVLRRSDLSADARLRALGTLARLRLRRMIWMINQSLRG